MAKNKHIERIGDTDANIRGNLDSLQIAIQTDSMEALVWANDGATEFRYAAAQYRKDAGGAITYIDSTFKDITARGDLFANEYIKRRGGNEESIRFEDSKITLAANSVNALVVEPTVVTSIVDVAIKSDSKSLLLGTDNDMDINYNGTYGEIDLTGVTASDFHINCGTEKTLILDKPVWKDINLDAAILSSRPGQQPDSDEFKDSTGTDTGIDTYSLAIDNGLDGSVEIDHYYEEGTDLYFHVHFQGITAPDGGTDNVNFQLIYTVARDGALLGAATTITKEIAFTTQYNFERVDFAAITGTSFLVGDQFLFNIQRIAASSDDYAGGALVATVGIHCRVNSMGSRKIITK